MSDLNLRNENRINEPITKTQEHLTILSLKCGQQTISASLSDGRKVTIPTAWFKRLRDATSEQLNNYELSPAGCAIHWEELEQEGLLVSSAQQALDDYRSGVIVCQCLRSEKPRLKYN